MVVWYNIGTKEVENMESKVKQLYNICFGTKEDKKRTLTNIYYEMNNGDMDLKKAFKVVVSPLCDLLPMELGQLDKYFLIESAYTHAEKALRKALCK